MMMELSLAKRRATLTSGKPSMLKDFLLDDLSSCSSNGFRSYPRRQCCTTVRFLLEIDMKNKPTKQRKKKINYNKPQQPPIVRSPLKPTGAPISAFQRASEAIINAVKHLPFPSFKSSIKYSSSSPSKLKLGILPRSLSRKFLSKRSFWKRNDHKEIQMWGPIINHLTDDEEEEENSSSLPRDFIISAAAAAAVSSNSSTSESSTTINSWSDSDFTNSDESLQSSTTNSSTTKIPEENNKKALPIDGVVSNSNSSSSQRIGVIVGGADDSMVVNHSSSSNSSTNSNSPPNTSKKSWPNEEKEQFSPVSVLDCPFEDDEEDEVSSSSPFQNRFARVEGTKKRLMKKIMRFELLTQLEPVNLVKRIAVSSESDQESIQDEFAYHIEEETTTAAEEKASEFLNILKNNNNNIKPNTENLLLDFFKLGYLESEKMEDLVAIAKDWVIGKNTTNEQVLGWKVKKNREMYIRDMEKNGEWKRRNKEKEEVGLEMEVEIFASLISELLDDLLL